MKILAIILTIFLLLGCSQDSSKGLLFIEYADSFEISPKLAVPMPEKLSSDVYESALKLRERDFSTYKEKVCSILFKHHTYYIDNFNQGYSFLSPADLRNKEWMSVGNNKYFLIREFVKFSEYTPSTNDGFPSASISFWMEEQKKISNQSIDSTR